MYFSDQYGSFSKASIGEAMELDLELEDTAQRKRASVDWLTCLPEPTSRFKRICEEEIAQLEDSIQSHATKTTPSGV